MTARIKLATLNRKDWGTPAWLFDGLNDEFGFAVDVCANSDNALCPEFYDTERDALSMVWRGSVFMNPPYGRELGAWMRKAALSADVNGATVVCLVPARTDVVWWHQYAMRGEIRFVRGRLRFRGAKYSAPFPSVVVVLGPRAEPGLGPVIARPRGADAQAQRSFFAMGPGELTWDARRALYRLPPLEGRTDDRCPLRFVDLDEAGFQLVKQKAQENCTRWEHELR